MDDFQNNRFKKMYSWVLLALLPSLMMWHTEAMNGMSMMDKNDTMKNKMDGMDMGMKVCGFTFLGLFKI